MVRVEKPRLICSYHGLAIVNVFLFVFVLIVVKPWLIFVRDDNNPVCDIFVSLQLRFINIC